MSGGETEEGSKCKISEISVLNQRSGFRKVILANTSSIKPTFCKGRLFICQCVCTTMCIWIERESKCT